ncbi:hypothetical protein PARPLA_01933 [Rhodobacteraceae bacterium THAF1]|uniref:YHS domain-containing (seleno)protein n=1 Tax=Palleronia sp. THAF1 TaxID=2587842 RepID=UPI000F3EFB01|nr:YHS domain-containing (seleno)protein [Palleronia sp. THAF1]QFU08932.1 hypothetical protein FIU81_09635 [Palleronia sp. THAF1]VDC24343.1 hypothetical protein PARPLA_01933 [Rhodobacteraceae bacterium THAF1]
MHRRTLLTTALALPFASAATIVRAAEPEIFTVGGLAIRGIDPAAYHAGAGPVSGSTAHSLTWRGAEWLFADADARQRFEASPDALAPAFGGYCAYAAARGYLAPTVPEAWTVHDGTLYLNASLRVRDRWLRNIDAEIANGRANWPAILG